MGFFFKPDHPLVTHIHKLIDQFGIDQYGHIKGTGYTFSNINTDYTGEFKYMCRGQLFNETSSVVIDIVDQYEGAFSLFSKAQKLIEISKQRIKDEAIQDRINSDIEKYLASHSPLPEAMEDLKQIEYHKKEIIKLSEKWQDKITSLHL